LYLAVIIDFYSRRVIGWAISNQMKRNLAIRALDMGVALRRAPKDYIHHELTEADRCNGTVIQLDV
jgi:putative transposase